MRTWNRIKSWVSLLLRRETPWTVKAILGAAIVYLLSPVDLIPDWILGFGLLDDLTIVSLLVALALKMAQKNELTHK
ncbi:MAG: DUF1232 domain-containing protein [Proteobacteria bacterium]|nr:DUF1232 domain-containing protein [Pseudomonadota bacterium]MBU1139660.1 DUF1232 domain-containing protein [Pseudomonadota bacterium]MBU1233392.1 DUF1232 domain-containing protein [Pseudomonadota bacterium]MBU1417267.1 DUF1232 domain-containing protein [Pseudomonadota bacterium]MBU1453990.1 DUF1232 domain-containing protein [Pseudomonadota bacterium]